MLPQHEFNRFVTNYNDDYRYILTRASTGSYNCLITSCRVLYDLYDVIIRLHDYGEVKMEIVPYPLTFRPTDEFLEFLGYAASDIENIRGFLEYVRQSQGKEIEDCFREGIQTPCNAE